MGVVNTDKIVELVQSIAQIPLGSSRLDTTGHTRQDELDWLDTSNMSSHVET